MDRLKILSLCDGISGGLMAFKDLGIPVEYHAVEIDKHARTVSDDNFMEIIRWENDVTKISQSNIIENGPFDWVIFGSPCQTVSVAGSQKGLQGSSGLLLDCLKVLKWAQEQNPNLKYLIENVKMKKEFLDQFNSLIGHEGVLINSVLLSAQRRERWYWCNFPITQPKDQGIVIEDILESTPDKALFFKPKLPIEVDKIRAIWDSSGKGHKSQQDRAYSIKYKSSCLSASRAENKNNIHQFVGKDKAYYIDSNYHKGTNVSSYFENSRRQLVFGYSKSTRYVDDTGKVHQSPGSGRVSKVESRIRNDGKANTLTTGDGCCNQSTLTLVTEQDRDENFLFRKLSVRECARLQTIPESYDFSSISNTQAYKGIGNGWTVKVISHILKEAITFEQEKLL